MKTLPSLSIFFPSLNDAKSLPGMVQKANTVAQKLTKKYEIIVINDGSTDNTKSVLKKLMRTYKKLRVITHPANQGYGAALISGFTTAKYDWVFYTDGDGQYDPSELTRLVASARNGVDVVNGYKKKRADSLLRRVIGSLYNWAMHTTHHLPIRDIDCDFRLIRRATLTKITLVSTTGAICLELITKLEGVGAIFAEIPVSHYPRRFGRSEFFRISHLFAMFRFLIGRRL